MFEGAIGVLASIYSIGFLITVGGVLLYNTGMGLSHHYDSGISLLKGLWLSAIWPITWIVVGWEIYKVNRDGA